MAEMFHYESAGKFFTTSRLHEDPQCPKKDKQPCSMPSWRHQYEIERALGAIVQVVVR